MGSGSVIASAGTPTLAPVFAAVVGLSTAVCCARITGGVVAKMSSYGSLRICALRLPLVSGVLCLLVDMLEDWLDV